MGRRPEPASLGYLTVLQGTAQKLGVKHSEPYQTEWWPLRWRRTSTRRPAQVRRPGCFVERVVARYNVVTAGLVPLQLGPVRPSRPPRPRRLSPRSSRCQTVAVSSRISNRTGGGLRSWPPVRVVPFPVSGTLPAWREHCAGTWRSFDGRNVAPRMLRPLASIYMAMGRRGSSAPGAVQHCPESPLTLVARAIEPEQEGHMELISRMMDGSVSYDGEHRLEPVLSRAAVREDQSRFKAVPIFAGCTEKQLRDVASIARIFDAPARSVLTRAGDPGDEFFLILDGTVQVEVASGQYVSLHPGAFFGEMSLLDGGPRSATAVSETPARLLVIDRANFSRLQREVPELTQTLLVTLSQRVRQVEARLEESARRSGLTEDC